MGKLAEIILAENVRLQYFSWSWQRVCCKNIPVAAKQEFVVWVNTMCKGKGAGLYTQWYCSVDCTIYPRSLGLFNPDSISTSQGAYSLAAHWFTELINWQCPHCPHWFLLLWYEGAVEIDLPKASSVTDSDRIWTHDLLVIGMEPQPTLPQWPQASYFQNSSREPVCLLLLLSHVWAIARGPMMLAASLLLHD